MKKLILCLCTVMALFVLSGCTSQQGGENNIPTVTLAMPSAGQDPAPLSPVHNTINFSSLEDFLSALKNARGDRDISNYVSRWSATLFAHTLDDVIEIVNFSSLEKIFLPTNIPIEYHLYMIEVTEDDVTFWYIHEDVLISENESPFFHFSEREILFFFTRFNYDSDTAKNRFMAWRLDEIIDDRYGFRGGNHFIWIKDNQLLNLFTPRELGSTPYDLIHFTETETVDLLDENAISGLLNHVGETYSTLNYLEFLRLLEVNGFAFESGNLYDRGMPTGRGSIYIGGERLIVANGFPFIADPLAGPSIEITWAPEYMWPSSDLLTIVYSGDDSEIIAFLDKIFGERTWSR